MQNAINTLRIQNFKSIKDVTMQPRRVNLLIGMPNVGKSNVLEALSLLGAGLYEREHKFMGDVLRYEILPNLFYDNDTIAPVLIESSQARATLYAKNRGNDGYGFVQVSELLWQHYIQSAKKQAHLFAQAEPSYAEKEGLSSFLPDSVMMQEARMQLAEIKIPYSFAECHIQNSGEYNGLRTQETSTSLLPKKYVYRPQQPHDLLFRHSFLEPPLGDNLWEVVQRSPPLRKEIGTLFRPYGLNLVLRVGERKFEIQKQVEDIVYNYPYSLIADTLQRIIFYLAAIESNDDSVLLFEEPEAHTFPVYTSMLGRKIVESKNNQFFVATHSPYLVTEILEQMLPFDNQLGELAIFLAYYEDYQTKIHQLSDEEIKEIRNDSIDVFYNLSRFTPGSNLYA